ncbi:hypothetical protein CI702_11680 [Escherichia coli]|nr:hypothetical protein CI702_11680 [Escherichia coli]
MFICTRFASLTHQRREDAANGKPAYQPAIQFNIIYIMRTNINQGRIQSLAVMIVLLINNGHTPYLT